MENERIILASSSPRRRELLEAVGCDFEVMVSRADETVPEGTPPEEAVVLLARRKCASAAALAPERVVLAADTLVAIDGVALGKPSSPEDAAAMLRRLSGREHSVFTGVAVRRGERERYSREETRVKFRRLDEREIERYVASGEPMDKAGAYGIQLRGALLVEGICGDYPNVVGLPLVLSARLLAEFGVTLL